MKMQNQLESKTKKKNAFAKIEIYGKKIKNR